MVPVLLCHVVRRPDRLPIMFAIFLKVLAIFLMVFAGFLIRRLKVVDETFNRQLSLLLINLFYPALILSSVVRNYTLESLAVNWPLPAGSVIIMCTGWMLGRLSMPWLQQQPATLQRTFRFQCTMNNYSFLPIMLVAGLLGERAVAQVVFASLGAELAMWTLGVQTLTGHTLSRRTIRNLFSLPMLALAVAIGLLICRFLLARMGLHAANTPATPRLVGEMLLNTCQMIGQATIPSPQSSAVCEWLPWRRITCFPVPYSAYLACACWRSPHCQSAFFPCCHSPSRQNKC